MDARAAAAMSGHACGTRTQGEEPASALERQSWVGDPSRMSVLTSDSISVAKATMSERL